MRFIYFILFAGVLCFAATSGHAVLTLPASDSFPSSATPDLAWNDYDSAYTLVEAFSPTAPGGDGYVFNVNDGSGWQDVYLADDDGTLSDYVATASIYMPTSDGTNWGRAGIYVRAQGTHYTTFRNGYFVFADTDGDDYLRVARYWNDGDNWDVPFQGSISRGTWHEFELAVVDTALIAKIDGQVIYSAAYAVDYATGYVGILCYQGTSSAPVTRCDRITIWEPGTIGDVISASDDVEVDYIKGVVTCKTDGLNTGRNQFYIQTVGTADGPGLLIDDYVFAASETVEIGDVVVLSGTRVTYYDTPEFEPKEAIVICATDTVPPAPQVVTVPQLQADESSVPLSYLSEVITLENMKLQTPSDDFKSVGTGKNITIEDGSSNTITLRVEEGSKLAETNGPGAGEFSVTGICTQYGGAYQIMPRVLSDIDLATTGVEASAWESYE